LNQPPQTNKRLETNIDIIPPEITNISAELEKLNKEISNTWKMVSDSAAVSNIDSIMPFAEKYLDSVRTIFEQQEGNYTYRSLENYHAEWSNYSMRLETWKGVVSSRVSVLNEEIASLDKHINIWDITEKDLTAKGSSEAIQEGISQILDSLGLVKSVLRDRENFNISLLNSIADKALVVENAKNAIKQYQLDIQAAYFFRDENFIWQKSDPEDHPKNVVAHVSSLFNENTRAINVFINNNLSSFYFHIIFTVFLFISFFYIRRRVVKSNIISEDEEIIETKAIILRPWAVALFISILSGMLIYSNRPIIFSEAIFLFLLIPLFFLLIKIIPKNLMFFVKIMIALFIIDEIQIFLDPSSFLRRLILLLESGLVIWFFYELWKLKKKYPEIFDSRIWRIIVNGTPLIIFIISVSVLGNIFGYVKLSNFLTNSIVASALITTTYYLLLKILRSLLIYGLRLYHKDFWYNENRIGIQKKVERILNLLVSIAWGITILRIFNVYRLLIDWLNQLMEIEWKFGVDGATTISLGGITSFFVIVIITYFLATWTKKLFSSEFVLRSKIPRGVPAAISMLARYIIVTFGVYIALAAAGVDLGQFGLIAGALGVGIGFGLQNVVYNFISGLIISFERPIHVGDVIEVGSLMGEVTEIGVRSSKVMTYDGSEVIVPNGNIISHEVINWTLSNQRRRLKILIRTDYNADPQRVLKIIREEAEKYRNTMKEPQVMALFDGYGDSSLDFTLYFWVNFNVSFTSKSEVALNIYETLKAEGIGVPIPAQRWYQERDGNPDHLLPGSGE